VVPTFEFLTSPRIIFGSGSLQQIGSIISDYGKKVLLVTGKDTSRAAPLIELMKNQSLIFSLFSVEYEPTVDEIISGVKLAKEKEVEVVIGFGGGSPLDAAKAIAALATNPGSIYDYLEVIGKGKILGNLPLPLIAIPTTSGTGSEVTKNAVITSTKDKVKVSLRHNNLIPRVAVLDPTLTKSCPPSVTAYSGMDALTQLIEPYLSPKANPLIDLLCIDGIKRISRSILTAYRDGNNINAREDLMLASLYGGIALTNAGLGAVHGFSGVIGGLSKAPHGAICARLLPFVLEANLKALMHKSPNDPFIQRFSDIASLLLGNQEAKIEDSIIYLKNLISDLNIPPLSAYPIDKTDFPYIIQQSRKASSMKNNMVVLSDAEMLSILEKAYAGR